jgi:hypothetical protein
MKLISQTIHNPIGAVGGAFAVHYMAKKHGVSHLWTLVAITAAGAIVGAAVQELISAKMSAPTAATVKG